MFFEFGIKDFIDILLVALILYYIYRLMRESRSLNVFIGILVFVVTWLFVSQVVEMKLLGSILDKLVAVGVIALIVLFQDEIRKFLYNVGAHRRMRAFAKMFSTKSADEDEKKALKEIIMPVVMASMNMSRGKVGALIVIERAMPLDEIADLTDGFTSSDIGLIVDKAGRSAFLANKDAISMDIIEKIIKESHSSVGPSERERYDEIRRKFEGSAASTRRKIGF